MDDEAENVASKFGGVPRVPRAFEWPHWNATLWLESQIRFHEQYMMMPWAKGAIAHRKEQLDQPEFPLAFLAQLNLAEVNAISADLNLPSTGQLLFFCDLANSTWGFDPASRGSSLVLHISDDEPLELGETPDNLDEEHKYVPCSLELELEQTLSTDLHPYGVDLQTYENDQYESLIESLIRQIRPIHRLGGFPEIIQNPMELECQLVTNGLYCGDSSGYNDPRAKVLQTGAADWRLLLQIDTDDEPGWMWGDCGRLYFWMREADIRSRSFENAWCVLQCS
jgi:uncharacterized protein YwqG